MSQPTETAQPTRDGSTSKTPGVDPEHSGGTHMLAVPEDCSLSQATGVPAGVMHRDKDNLLRRLKRIEGQVRGLQRMVDEDKYCVDILVQVAAVRAALNKVGLMLLEGHTRGCVTNAIANNAADAAIDELMDVINRFLR